MAFASGACSPFILHSATKMSPFFVFVLLLQADRSLARHYYTREHYGDAILPHINNGRLTTVPSSSSSQFLTSPKYLTTRRQSSFLRGGSAESSMPTLDLQGQLPQQGPMRRLRRVLSFQSKQEVVTQSTGQSIEDSTAGEVNSNQEISKVELPRPPDGSATISSEIMNLSKAIVGAGVLGLPAGLATFYTSRPTTAIIAPTLVLITVIGSLSAYGFYCIACVCDATNARSYRQAWSQTVSAKSSVLPAVACLLVTLCTTITCSMILHKTTGQLIPVTLAILLPLCLQKELKRLVPFSFVGTLGMVYTAAIMVLRWVTKAYTVGSRLYFLADMAEEHRPIMDVTGYTAAVHPWLQVLNIKRAGACVRACEEPSYRSAIYSFTTFTFHSSVLFFTAIFISMLSTSFMCHYNSPRLFWELENTSPKRFQKVVIGGFGTAIAIMSTIALAGFSTFGFASSGMILNNYAPTDGLAILARAAVTLSVIFSFPLAFVGVREGFLDLLEIPTEKRQGKLSLATTLLGLTLITSLALSLNDIRLVLAIGGSTWGMCVMYLFPAIMVVRGADKYPSLQSKAQFAMTLGAIGVGIGSMGIYRTLTTFL